jgi:hypothetical protein
MGSLLLSPSLAEASLDPSASDIPHWPPANPNVAEGIERPAPYARRTYASCSSPLMRLFSTRDLLKRRAVAKRAQTRRVNTNSGLNQSMLKDHLPELRPSSLPVHRRTMTPTPLVPRSLPSLGWQKDSSHKIRHDPPKRDPFPFPHSPSGSPSPPNPDHPEPNHVRCLSNPTVVGQEGPTFAEGGGAAISAPPTARALTPDQPTTSTGTAVELKFLTIDVQKAGTNSPSLTDIMTMVDQHSPDFLLLKEIPLAPHSGALREALRNRGYRIHTLRPTIRSNRRPFRRPAFPSASYTQEVGAGWPTRNTLLGRHLCPPSHCLILATLQRYAR